MTPPAKPSRWTRNALLRSAGAVARGLLVVGLVALVAWPAQIIWLCIPCQLEMGRTWRQTVMRPGTVFIGGGRSTGYCDCSRDSSLRVILGKWGE